MEERKLNFNAPLLSVRRFSMTSVLSDGENGKIIENSLLNRRHTLPSYRTDLALDPVTEPVAVPFLWEHIPGRAKSGIGPLLEPPKEPYVTPRLPPGRVLDIIKQPLEKEFKDQNGIKPQNESSTSTDEVSKWESVKEGKCEEGGSELDNEDDVYSDALDTLSPTDSFSLIGSVSGLSGSDSPAVKPFGTFSTDPQTRDFMMSRFLSAARAMVLEPPQFAARKQPVAVEQVKQVTKVVGGERKRPLNQYGCNVMPHYGLDKEEEECEDEDDEYDDSGDVSAKACGLFPRLCFKNSLCLLNPVPGMKVRTRAPMYSTSEVGRSSKAASIGSRNQTLQKHAWNITPKHKSYSGFQSPKLQEVKDKLTSEFNQFTYSANLQTTDRPSPYRQRGDGTSPYQNDASQSPFHEVGFLGIPKEVENFKSNRLDMDNKDSKNFQKVLTHLSIQQGSGSANPAVEKTLYVDTVNIAEITYSNSNSTDTKGWMNSAGEDFETMLETRGMEETATEESSFQDIKCLNVLKKGSIPELEVSRPVDDNVLSFSDTAHLRSQADAMEGFRMDQGLDRQLKTLECSKVSTDGNLNIKTNNISKADDTENLDSSPVQSHFPPPLPKSPSESWLWRNLPSISSQNPFSRSFLGTPLNPKKPDSKTSSTSIKWETIVKTSNLHHDHVRCSEELIAQISQQSKN